MTKILSTVILALLFNIKSFAQEGIVTINQDKKLTSTLEARKKLLESEELRTHYTIQVFSGEIKNAQLTLKDCKSNFTDYKSQIFYETPHYKVWVGEFRSKLAADRALLQITQVYPGAFVFEPGNKKSRKQ